MVLGFSPPQDRPRIRLTLSHHFILADGTGRATEDLWVKVGGTGGPWMVVEIDGPTYSSTVKPTPDHTQLLRYPGLTMGKYTVNVSIRADDNHILASDSGRVVVQ